MGSGVGQAPARPLTEPRNSARLAANRRQLGERRHTGPASGHRQPRATKFPIIGDPVKYVESPTGLTRTLGHRNCDGYCVPMQVPADDLDAVMTGLTAARNVDGTLVTMPHNSPRSPRSPGGSRSPARGTRW